MDRREAIEYVKQAFAVWQSEFCTLDGDWSKETEALDLAIEALKREVEYGQMVVDFTKGETINSDEWKYDTTCDAESATTTDCISRQAVEEMIKAELPERGMWEIEGDKEKETVCEVCFDLMQKLSELPPVTPPKKIVAQINIDIDELIERIKEEYEITDKVGEWIYGNGHGECSICKHEKQYGWDNYCGNCGAKMKGKNK